MFALLCISGSIPRLSFVQHNLYGGVCVSGYSSPLHPSLIQGAVRKDGADQNILRPQGVFNVPLYFNQVTEDGSAI